ncbi:MAG: HAMP domain-containing histidine kinase [Candidatus Portnoybacteria bacterium]|nr:HAMP domain-containing histidine kinase [Candidatus Portnoybacteria bacterium]
MSFSSVCKKMPLFRECFEFNIPLWQCPSFLFLVLGLLNIAAMISTYFISNYFTDQPEITALMTILVSLIVFIIGSTIVRGFDKLIEANKMKTEFIRVASHQLRTPLSALRWALDFMAGGSIGQPTEEQKEYLQIMKDSDARMIKLVNDLLDVTKIEMGNLPLVLKPVNLAVIAQDIIRELSPMAKAANVSIVFEADEDLPMVLSDPDKMRMVFTNLMDNAIKYTKGKGQVNVAAQKKGDYIQVSVRDEGVGIPKNQQKFIFQKFFRSDNVMKHQTVGTGLGLFIVKAIVDANNGSIWFESQEDKGATFYFKIPIAK